MMRILCSIYFFASLASPFSYGQSDYFKNRFDTKYNPSKPNYALVESWASLPFMKDPADSVPGTGQLKNLQDSSVADVFFIHPTSFTHKAETPHEWNADITDTFINRKTDYGTILYQASVFNGAGKIYAPRYRQAHYNCYLTKDTQSARMAFELAYSDIKDAFDYYLNHYNQGKPFIIASHSQGTTHAIKLLKEYLDTKPLQEKLICAYIVGMPVYDTLFKTLKPCSTADETGCYCCWQTYAVGFYPKNYVQPKKYTVCTNPLLWTVHGEKAKAALNKGGTLRDFRKIIPKLCDAQVKDGVLRINKPNIPGKAFLKIKNYHIGDYNLFYMNIRENAASRTAAYLKKIGIK